jgi:hypothetical protein
MTLRSLLWLMLAACFQALTTPAAKLPEKLRLLSCDLGGLAIQAPTGSANDPATELKRLLDKADPDVVFLQRVADWDTCERIARLRPGLRVLTCSGFSGASGQVSVLARDKAVLSWVDEIADGNGFAFVVIQAGPRKLGVFSIQNKNANTLATTDRIIAEVKKLQQFANNRPESIVVAGPGLIKSTLGESGFETVASDALENSQATPVEFWASNAGFLSRPRSIAVGGIAAPALVADIDTANTFSSKFAYQNQLLFPGESPAPVQVVVQAAPAPVGVQAVAQPPGSARQFPWGLAATIGFVAILVLVFVFRRKPTMAVVPVSDPNLPANEMLSDPVRLGLLAWLKTIFMQRLIADRRKMIADEAEATRRTLAIEQKLTELQISLQDRISAYENRIARLESELSAATFENRELIRLQISELKEKVAKAKEEFSFRRN